MYANMYKSGDDFATSLKDTTLPSIKGSLLGDSDSLTAYIGELKTKLGTVPTHGTKKPEGSGLYVALA
jgi:hypothetical protein